MSDNLKCRICGADLYYHSEMISCERMRQLIVLDEAIEATKEGRKPRKIPTDLIDESNTAYLHHFICSKNKYHNAIVTTPGNNKKKAICAYQGIQLDQKLKER